MSEELTAQWASSLRRRRQNDEDLTARCLRASVEQQLFGHSDEVAIAGVRFALRRRLGAGAMGTVYEVERTESAGVLALKVLHRSGSEHAYRLKREFRTLSQLGHPNLVALYELYADTTGSAFTMELVHGVDLLSHLRGAGERALLRLRDVFGQLAEALAFLHAERVVHRDLKPSNILVQPDGRVVLLDFGVALAGPELDVSGTARFMAREQRRGQTVAASDLYAVGVMLELALDACSDQVGARAGALPEQAELRALSARLKSPDPAQRPSARQLQHALKGSLVTTTALRAPGAAGPGFVGRERELAELLELALRPHGGPRVARIDAGCGLGKSALLAELGRTVARDRRGALVLGGRCCRRETVRYRALDPVLDALSDALLSAPSELVDALAGCVTSHLLALFPVLERVPAFTEHRRGAAIADAREQRAAAIAALRELLVRLGQQRELLVVVDDSHWLDDESSALIAELLEGPNAPRIVWVFAARPNAPVLDQTLARRVAPPHRLQIALAPFAPGEARALCSALLPERAELWPRVIALAAGSPFALCQLCHLAQDHAELDAALGIERVIDRRVAALPACARDLLHVVALSVEPLTPATLCEIAGIGALELEQALHLLEAQRYVRTTTALPLRVEPYHAQIAEFSLGALPAGARVELHRKLALALERRGGPARARTLLHHHRQAGDDDKALRFAELAAEQSRARFDFHEAAALFAQCCELAPDAAGRERFARARAEALVHAGRDREAGELLQALARDAVSPAERFELACAAARLFFQAGYSSEAIRVLSPWLNELGLRPHRTRLGQLGSCLYHRVLLAFDRIDPRPAATAAGKPGSAEDAARIELCLLASRGFGRSDVLQSVDYVGRLAWHARRGANDAQRANVLLLQALIAAALAPASGRTEALLASARTLCDAAADSALLARWYSVVAYCSALRLDRGTMRSHAERAVQLFESHGQGVHMELAEARLWWLITRFASGELVQAQAHALARDAAARGDRHSEGNTRSFHGVTLLASGEPGLAQAEIARAFELNGASNQGTHYFALGNRARIELYEGAPLRATATLSAALRAMAPQGPLLLPWLRIELRYLLALALLQGSGARAAPRVRAIVAQLSSESMRWPQLIARQLRAALLASSGERRAAALELRAVAVDMEREGGAWYRWASLLLAYRCERDAAGERALLASLRERGIAEPRAFLTAYAPLGAEFADGHV
jgi:hypothetical protein